MVQRPLSQYCLICHAVAYFLEIKFNITGHEMPLGNDINLFHIHFLQSCFKNNIKDINLYHGPTVQELSVR